MTPDAIEWEAKCTGMRREGAYYGIWTFCSKTAQARIRIILGPATVGAFLIGILVLSRYPINEAVYAELIADRGSAGPVTPSPGA